MNINTDKVLLPVRLMFFLASYCNSRCITCNYHMNPIRKDLFTFDKLKEISNDWFELCDKYDPQGYHEINMSGFGEPTLCSYIWDYVNYTKDVKKNVNMTLITNSMNIMEQDIPKIVDSGLDVIIFSINSHIPEVHDYSRGIKGNFDHVTNLAKKFQEYKDQHNLDRPIIVGSSILSDWNMDHFIDFLKWVEDFKYFKTISFAVEANMADKKEWIKPESKPKLIEVLQECRQLQHYKTLKMPDILLKEMIGLVEHETKYNSIIPCKAPQNILLVNELMNVTSCMAKTNEMLYGNVNHQSLKDIILKPFNQKLMAYRMKGHCYRYCGVNTCSYQ